MTPFAREPDASCLMPLRVSGAGTPLFCFPGAGGDVLVFREMIAALPEGQPIYAVDMEWLCEAEQEFTIEQLAAFCLDVIRKTQKSGPYYFCGYSFGGLVAYEIALRLVDEGESANLVALLDTLNPALLSSLSVAASTQFRRTYRLDRLRKYGRHLVRGEIQAFMGNGLAFVGLRARTLFTPSIKRLFRMMNRPLPAALRGTDPAFLKAWHSYIPKRYPKGLVCFRAQDRGPEHDRDPTMGWEACAAGGVQVHVVPARHVDMLRMPYVRALADRLASYLDGGSDPKKEPGSGTP